MSTADGSGGEVAKVVVFGATGVVGRAAAAHFGAQAGTSVIGISRRPVQLSGVAHVSLDLGDGVACRDVLGSQTFAGTSHVVFAALLESPDLAGGWRDPELMLHNLRMFENALGSLSAVHPSTLRHVTLLQGAKAYGFHVGRSPIPGKERTGRDDHENFYFLQEDALRRFADRDGWAWTVLRPQVVYGESLGSPMNLIPAIGAYAAIERARGRALAFPGGPPSVQEAVDARLLARAIGWAATNPGARNEIFNVTNGDAFGWRDVWPVIAAAFDMKVGDANPKSLATEMPTRADEWAAVVDREGLAAPRSMEEFVGGSWAYADILFGSLGSRSAPALLSTVKIRQAGFSDCVDTEDMFRYWFEEFQRLRLLPR